ncbi:response regulator [Bradyrhizobium centrosematis]|uniref:response regulator n=1 Tax=Bradyrhizobium centrosematis TaxID=1300039 RepID=UPI00388FF33F
MATSSMSSHPRGPLAGRRIFIVEDEYFLADDIGNAFRALGAEIAGPAGHFEDAVKILNDGSVLDAAVLDVNIRSDMIFPVARELKVRGVPFVFTTGYDKVAVGPEFHDVPLLEKPIDLPAMAQKLASLIAETRT